MKSFNYFRKFVEVPAGHLDNAVVEAGFEAGRGHIARDRVAQFDQRFAQTKLGGHVCQRVAGGLASQRRATRQPCIHLDDEELKQQHVNFHSMQHQNNSM